MTETDESDDRPLSREKRIEIFGEEFVEHSEWWDGEIERLGDVMDELVTVIENREDARVSTRSKNTRHSGKHRIGIEVIVAGEPWEGYLDE